MINASEQLGIDLATTNLQKVLKDFLAIRRGAADAEKSVSKLNRALAARGGHVPAITGPVGGSPSVNVTGGTAKVTGTHGNLNIYIMVQGGGGGVGTSVARSGSSSVVAPYGRFQRRERLRRILRGGGLSHAQLEDTRDAYERNERLIERGRPAGRVMTALMSTRLNLGHASPLVGRSLAALGVDEAAAAPPLLIAGAALAAAAALYKVVESAAELGNSFTRLEIQTGSGGLDSARLISAGTAGGMSPETMAGIAESIQQHITSSPEGMAAGLRLGVHNLPGIFGDQDIGAQALEVLKNLRNIKDPTEQLRLARGAGAEGLLPITKISDHQFDYVEKDAQTRSNIMTPQFLQDSADFQASMGRVGDALQNIFAAAGRGEMDRLTNFFNGLADGLNTIATWMESHKGFVDMMMRNAELLVSPLVSAGIDMTNHGGLQQSLDANTAETRRNTGAMQPGSYGRITRGAVLPPGLNGQSLGDGNTYALSTF